MANLERAIYSIAYYWHGISKRAVLNVLWLYEKLHQTIYIPWSEVDNLPYNQDVVNVIEHMIVRGDLRVTDRWKQKFGKIGLEPIQIKNNLKIYKSSDFVSDNFRLTVKYFLKRPEEFKQFYTENKDKYILSQRIYRWVKDRLLEEN